MKIVIANRGEIACRIIKTARRMNIQTVAVYSEMDKESLHVRMADERFALGGRTTAESYLVMEKILKACRQTGARAVHPGYGFLAENDTFAQLLIEEGLLFIGPNPDSIRLMGDKIESKKLAQAAGVSTIPGYIGEIRDLEHAKSQAEAIGYPVMIKASAGGGGKGMRIVWSQEGLETALATTRRESVGSFGDDRLLIERFIESPRHIEIQVMADKHGTVIFLGERECSTQRRHQKVIEEAPSPFVSPRLRQEMGEQAVALARAVQYDSAGTVEFIVDPQGRFYFLEMNTRLQVEHPVTELVSGYDLVELMIKAAQGERLGLTQEDVVLEGWAFESRLYAEDPSRDFLPSIGKILRYRTPPDDQAVRVHTGVYEGAEISMYYDPMIAKICTWGRDRVQALETMRHALDRIQIGGIKSNLHFLARVFGLPRFQEGRLSTHLIEEEFRAGFQEEVIDEDHRRWFCAIAVSIHSQIERRNRFPKSADDPKPVRKEWVIRHQDKFIPVRLEEDGWVWVEEDRLRLRSDWRVNDSVWEGEVEDGETLVVQVEILESRDRYRLSRRGQVARVQVLTPSAADLYRYMSKSTVVETDQFLRSPMPGLLVEVFVAAGQAVDEGEALCVVEAMKMENILYAPHRVTIKDILLQTGQSVGLDEAIIEFA